MSNVTVPDFAVGEVLSGPTRPISLQRAGWYSVGIFSAATGKPAQVQRNIHTDHDYARTQGFTAAIADGMHSTNWLSSMLSAHFGEHYIVSGQLRTKFIKPTMLDVPITAKAVVTERTESAEGVQYTLDVWCEDGEGTKLTVGDAAVLVTGQSK